MKDKINEALLQLENDLQEIDSAKKQVEKTVDASIALQTEVRSYVDAVNEMCVKVKNTANNFKTNTESSLKDFKEQNDILTERVNELNNLREEIEKAAKEINTLKDTLAQISKDLKDSQEAQDAVLNEIKQKVHEVSDAIANKANRIINMIESFSKEVSSGIRSLHERFDNQDAVLNDIKQKVLIALESIENLSNRLVNKIESLSQEIKSGIRSLHERLDNLGSALSQMEQNIKSDLQSSTDIIKSTIEESNKQTAKNININRWIIIVGIILLAILHFVIK